MIFVIVIHIHIRCLYLVFAVCHSELLSVDFDRQYLLSITWQRANEVVFQFSCYLSNSDLLSVNNKIQQVVLIDSPKCTCVKCHIMQLEFVWEVWSPDIYE